MTPAPGPDPNRRTRLGRTLDPELRGWLRRAAVAHAHIAGIVRLFGNPGKAGGQSLAGDGYGERIRRGDKTVLRDCVVFAREELDAIAAEIERRMDATPPTKHLPGSPGKIAVLMARLEAGDSLFVSGDAQGHAPPQDDN